MQKLLYISASIILFLACTQMGNAQNTFREVAVDWGIEHYHQNINYIGTGGGVAIFDFNNDGFQDLYFTGGYFQDELFKNNGNKTFTPVGVYAGLSITKNYNTKSVTTGDINNDGYRDIFITTEGGRRNLFFLNNGDGTFTEMAIIYDVLYGTGAIFGDFNLDGFLDLYVIRHIESGNALVDEDNNVIGFDHTCYANSLYLSDGHFTFTKQEDTGSEDEGCGLAVVATNIDDDYNLDLFVVNDFGEWVEPNGCYLNNFPEISFSNVSESSGLDAQMYGMGIAVGDHNRDGLLDYYVTNIGSNKLFQNQGNGRFIDVALESNVQNTFINDKFSSGWGTAFFDFDHDGFEDLFVANGFVQAAPLIVNDREQTNVLYRNLGNGTFEDVTTQHDLLDTHVAKGMAVGDLDNDGDLEIVVTAAGDDSKNGNVLVYENLLERNHSWLKVMVEGVSTNRDGLGTTLKAYYNNIQWIDEVEGGSSYASHNSTITHFGLGETTILDSLIVIWPGGKKQKYENIETDHTIYIKEDAYDYLIAGCADESSVNYDPLAEFDFGCYQEIRGCTDQNAINFDINANVDDGNCVFENIPLNVIGYQSDKHKIEIYPNPMRDETVIKFSNPQETEFKILITSISGQEVFSATALTSHYRIQRRHMNPGIYIVKITSDSEEYFIRLVVK